MKLKEKLKAASVAIITLTYIFMIVSAVQNDGVGFSPTTFGLWAILSWIICFSMLKQGASIGAPLIYGTGATALTVILLFKGNWNPTAQDAVTAVLVGVCLVLWKTRGAKWALIMSVTAGLIASFPFIRMTWQNPESSPLLANCLFLAGNILSLSSVERTRIEDLLFPVSNVALCVCLVAPCVI